MKNTYDNFVAGLSICDYKVNEPLAPYTSFKIGGPADLIVFPKHGLALATVLHSAWRNKVPVLVFGNGTNMLVSDRGFRGVVIKLAEGFRSIEFSGTKVVVNAARSLPKFVNACMERGLTGMEWAVGIPGTIGGALVMNAGAYGGQMSDVVKSVYGYLPDGDFQELPSKDIHFDYRHAEYPKGFVITGCILKLRPGRKQAIKRTMEQWLARRAANQPLSQPSAGCIFKNPPNDSARRLIGVAGMRGMRVGGAQVSSKHANFIVNRGGATARDVLALSRMVQAAVAKELGVRLVPEVRLIGQR
jgi:UDP-N-acetylmuramate dehydrogenase